MAEVQPGLHQISQILGPRYLFQYLLVGERSLLIDTGIASTPDEHILPYLRKIDLAPDQLDYLVISHADVDHMGGNAAMRAAAPKATLACHRLDAPWIGSRQAIMRERYGWYRQFDMDYPPDTGEWIAANIGPDVRIDLELTGGETFRLADDRPLHVLHLPGHSPGHLGFYDEANKAVLVIDAILWRGLLDMEDTLISPPPYFQIQPYLDSIDAVLALDFEHLYTGHYANKSGEEARRWLEESKAFVLSAHETVAEILRSSGRAMTMPEIHEAANQAIGPYTAFAIELVGPLYAHLQQLIAEGEAATLEIDGRSAWRAL